MARDSTYEWTEREDNFLRASAPNMTVRELTEGLSSENPYARSQSSVKHRLIKLKINYKRGRRGRKTVFTDESLAFLQKHAKTMRPAEIAVVLGISYTTVYNRLRSLGAHTGLKLVSEWKTSLIALEDVMLPLYEAGIRLEIREKDKLLAVFATKSLEEMEEMINEREQTA